VTAASNHSFTTIACHEQSGYLFLHVGTTSSGTYPRIYNYNKEGTTGYPLDRSLSHCPGTVTQCLSSNIEGAPNASYVMVNGQKDIYWVRSDNRNRIGISKIPAKVLTAKDILPKKSAEQEQIEQISVAMPSSNGVLIFCHDQQSRGYVTRANVRTGSSYSYKVSLELSA
jgi:hypothetical protein